MSLSKYFKNSASFKAEGLLKQSDKAPAGWTPTPKRDGRPFQSQKLSPQVIEQNSKGEKASPLPQQQTLKNARDDEIPATPEPTVDTSTSANDFDPSKYVAFDEAEKMATEAYRQGLDEGRKKAEDDFGSAARALFLSCQQLDTLRSTIITNSSKELLDFSLTVAEKIIRFSVREQDLTIVATIEEALRRAVKSDEFTIHIHPDDYDSLISKTDGIIAGISGLNNIVLRKDTSIERGGARIESDNCTIDATIAGQFEVIREELKNKQLNCS
jgi:flagellar assembly protein FliH